MAVQKPKTAWGECSEESVQEKRARPWLGLQNDFEAPAVMRFDTWLPAQEKREQEVASIKTKAELAIVAARGKREQVSAEKERKLLVQGQEREALKSKVEAETKAKVDYARPGTCVPVQCCLGEFQYKK